MILKMIQKLLGLRKDKDLSYNKLLVNIEQLRHKEWSSQSLDRLTFISRALFGEDLSELNEHLAYMNSIFYRNDGSEEFIVRPILTKKDVFYYITKQGENYVDPKIVIREFLAQASTFITYLDLFKDNDSYESKRNVQRVQYIEVTLRELVTLLLFKGE